MRRSSPLQSLAASPTMVGAVTTLIVIVAVFLAYNANNGLPFVPTYRVAVVVPNGSRLVKNNEVRIGGTRVGVVESIDPTRVSPQQIASKHSQRRPGRRMVCRVCRMEYLGLKFVANYSPSLIACCHPGCNRSGFRCR